MRHHSSPLSLPVHVTILASTPCIRVSHGHEVALVSRRGVRIAAKSKAQPAKLEVQATGVLLKKLGRGNHEIKSDTSVFKTFREIFVEPLLSSKVRSMVAVYQAILPLNGSDLCVLF